MWEVMNVGQYYKDRNITARAVQMALWYETQYKYQNEDTQSPYWGNSAKCQNVLDITHTHFREWAMHPA